VRNTVAGGAHRAPGAGSSAAQRSATGLDGPGFTEHCDAWNTGAPERQVRRQQHLTFWQRDRPIPVPVPAGRSVQAQGGTAPITAVRDAAVGRQPVQEHALQRARRQQLPAGSSRLPDRDSVQSNDPRLDSTDRGSHSTATLGTEERRRGSSDVSSRARSGDRTGRSQCLYLRDAPEARTAHSTEHRAQSTRHRLKSTEVSTCDPGSSAR